MKVQHTRIARPAKNLDAVLRFYRDILGFEVLCEFADHDGFDGVMLGEPTGAVHLEFTRERGAPPAAAPSPEDLLVLYLDEQHWTDVTRRIRDLGVSPVVSHNPYWDRNGVTFEDPDGYRVVLHRGPWRP